MVVVAPASTSNPELPPDELEPVDAVLEELPDELDDEALLLRLLELGELLALLELAGLLEREELEADDELALLLEELAGVEEDAPLLDDPPVEDPLGAKHLPPLQTLAPPQSALVWHGAGDELPLEHAVSTAARPIRSHLAIFDAVMQPPPSVRGRLE